MASFLIVHNPLSLVLVRATLLNKYTRAGLIHSYAQGMIDGEIESSKILIICDSQVAESIKQDFAATNLEVADFPASCRLVGGSEQVVGLSIILPPELSLCAVQCHFNQMIPTLNQWFQLEIGSGKTNIAYPGVSLINDTHGGIAHLNADLSRPLEKRTWEMLKLVLEHTRWEIPNKPAHKTFFQCKWLITDQLTPPSALPTVGEKSTKKFEKEAWSDIVKRSSGQKGTTVIDKNSSDEKKQPSSVITPVSIEQRHKKETVPPFIEQKSKGETVPVISSVSIEQKSKEETMVPTSSIGTEQKGAKDLKLDANPYGLKPRIEVPDADS